VLANTEENRMKLAQHVVDGWDFEDLVSFAVTTMYTNYTDDPVLYSDDIEHYEFEGVKENVDA